MIKKRNFALLMTVILTLSMATGFQPVSAANTIYVNSTYDNGSNNNLPNMSNFTGYNTSSIATIGVTNPPANSKPGKVLTVETKAGGGAAPNINYVFSDSGKAGIIYAADAPVLVLEMNIRIESLSIRRTIFGLRDNLDYCPSLAVIDAGQFMLCNQSGSPIQNTGMGTCEVNRWYHIMAKVDMNNRTYDFFIDGERVLDDQAIYATATTEGTKGLFNKSVKFIRMEHVDNNNNTSLGGKTYYDDYKVYTESAAAAPSVSATTDLANTSYLANSIDLSFGTSMKKNMLNNENITVTKVSDGTAVPYTAALKDSNYYRLSFAENVLEADTAYRINFSNDVQDLFGNKLGDNYSLNMKVVNSAPSAEMVSFVSGRYIKSGSNYILKARASDLETSVSALAFYNGDTKIGDAILENGIYTYQWGNIPEGEYSISAVAVDSNGKAGKSAAVSLNVAEMTNIVSADFSTSTAGWVPYNNNNGSAVGVMDDPFELYGKSAVLSTTAGVEGNPNINRTEFEQTPYSGLLQFETFILPTTDPKTDSGIEIKGKNSTGTTVGSLLVKFAAAGDVRNAQDVKIGTYTPGQWQHILVLWNTYTTNYTLWINGTRYDMQLKNPLTSFNYFRLYIYSPSTATSNANVLFDNVSIDSIVQRPKVSQVNFKDSAGNVSDIISTDVTQILLTFSSDINPDTATDVNITLSEGFLKTPVNTTGTYDAATKTYTMNIEPYELPLKKWAQYHILISKDVKTAAGQQGIADAVIDCTVDGGILYGNITDFKANGSPVFSADNLSAGDALSVYATVKKSEAFSPQVTLIAAVYSNQKIIAVAIDTKQLLSADGEKTFKADLTIPQGFSQGDTVKAFVWQGLDSMIIPISNSEILQ